MAFVSIELAISKFSVSCKLVWMHFSMVNMLTNSCQVLGAQGSIIHATAGSSQASIQVTNARSAETVETTKRPRAKGGSKVKAKRMKQDSHNATLRPIAPRVVAVPMSSQFLIAAPPAASQVSFFPQEK